MYLKLGGINGHEEGKNSHWSQRSLQYRIPLYELCNLGRALKKVYKRSIGEAATNFRLKTERRIQCSDCNLFQRFLAIQLN